MSAFMRTFIPGSPWLYVKLYAGTSGVSDVLRRLGPLLARFVAERLIDQWFFIRYGDPDWHLRLRLHGAPAALYGEVFAALHAAAAELVAEGLVYKVQLDTYEREVERYGGPQGVEASERLFHADSEAVLALISAYEGDEGGKQLAQLALPGIDHLLDALGLSLDAKSEVVANARRSFQAEFQVGSVFEDQISQKYRAERAGFAPLLGDSGGGSVDAGHSAAAGLAILRARKVRLQVIGEELSRLSAEGRLTRPVSQLAGSYAHMFVNRLLRAEQRAQELVLYDFLQRHYRSLKARAR